MIPHPNGRDGELQHASIQAHWNAGEDRTFSAQEKEETVFTLGGASLCPGLVWFWPFRPQCEPSVSYMYVSMSVHR